MNKLRIALLIITLGGMCFGFQESDGTTACNNYRANSHKCACGRAMHCGMNGHGSGDPDEHTSGPNSCFNKCRKDLCMCQSPCTSHHPR